MKPTRKLLTVVKYWYGFTARVSGVWKVNNKSLKYDLLQRVAEFSSCCSSRYCQHQNASECLDLGAEV